MIHGTISGYKNHGCRCAECTKAVSRNLKRWRMRTRADQKTGVPEIPDLIPIAPAREHYWLLRASGWTVADVAGEVGVTTAHLSWLMGPANTRLRAKRQRVAAILSLEPLVPVDFDEVAVERFISFDLAWQRLSTGERLEAARRMDARGVSRNEIAERTHLNSRTLWAAFEPKDVAS